MTQNVSGTEAYTNDINNNFAAAKTAIANCAPISLVQTVNGKVNVSDIASTVNAQSTNTVPVGAKLFYDELAGKSDNNHTHSYNSLSDKPTIPTVPTVLSAFTNDSGFQTAADVQTAISNSNKLERDIVTELPAAANASAKKIYLILKSPAGESGNVYDEFMLINGAMEKIGDTKVDLSGYAKTTAIPTKTSDLTDDMLTGYSKASTVAAVGTSDSVKVAIGKLEKQIDGKQASGSYAASDHTHSEYLTAHQSLTGYLQTSDIASTVNAQSTNAKPVGAKLFYDTVGDIESVLDAIIAGT